MTLTKEQVRQLQQRLNDLGYNAGEVDGLIGPNTNSAVIAFKRDHGLRPRALIGELTWKKLMEPQFQEIQIDKDELPWIREARKALNRHEVYDNEWLKKWLSSDGHALGDPAKLPWCGDFVETSIRLGLPNEPVPKNPYWALNWREFGIATQPTYGAIASISRSGGGHVMFIIGQDANRYFVMGGNQQNKSSIVPVDKRRFEASSFRWPSTYPTRPIRLPRMSSSDASNTSEV